MMSKKKTTEDAIIRWSEEVDIEDFLSEDEAFESFRDWINPEAGKNVGFEVIEEKFHSFWQEFIEKLPIESREWFKFVEETGISPERAKYYHKAYESALQEQEWRKAWGKFWGNLPRAERSSPEAKRLWGSLKRFYGL